MRLKFDTQTKEKDFFEAQEKLKLENEALTISLNELSRRTKLDIDHTKKEYEKKTNEIANIMSTKVFK